MTVGILIPHLGASYSCDEEEQPAEAASKQHQQQPNKIIAVLTLRKHLHGIWITNLVDELSTCTRMGTPDNQSHTFKVEVVALESLDLDLFPTSSSPPWAVLVNRVSDAADPMLAKSALAVLQAAELWGIPIFNGPRSYSICCNKVLHHHVFARSGLKTPRSVKIRFGTTGVATGTGGDDDLFTADKLSCAARQLKEMGCNYPILIKPNAAGFGAGIKLFSDEAELLQFSENMFSALSSDTDIILSEDGVALLQEYIRPVDDCIYRVWFLNGKVQCAVKRVLIDSDNNPANDFTSGCAGGSCSLAYMRKKKRLGATTFAWNVPCDVTEDIVRMLKVVGSDCDAGSVELLCDKAGGKIYFDLNLLSTLPLADGSIDNKDNVWPEKYNPWSELADAVLDKGC